MKLLLCSEGFHTPNTVQACVELVDKPQNEITVAIINEAYAVEEGDKRWVLDNLNDVATNFPAKIDLINLLALPLTQVKARIELCDVIFVVGGHTDYLMYVFNKTGFAKLLPELLTTKVYVGSSAGSMVVGRRVTTEAYAEIYGESGDWPVKDFLNLVDFAIKPHLNSEVFPKNRKENLFMVTRDYAGLLYGLADDSAIVVDNKRTYTIGSKPVRIKDGAIVE